MKKGCLIVLIVLAVLVLGAVVAATMAARSAGAFASPVVSHDTVATPKTRLWLVVNPAPVLPILMPLIPTEIPDNQLPVAVNPQKWIEPFLPREVALMAAPNFATGKADLTLFVNEQRGGPTILKLALQQGLPAVPQIQWTGQGIELPERGNLQLRASMPIPDGVEEVLAENWKQTPPSEPLRITGGHQVEAMLDNRNGDLLTLAAAVVQATGNSWAEIFEQQKERIMPILPGIHDIRLVADLVDLNRATAVLRIDASEDSGMTLQFLLGMAWVQVVAGAESKYGVTIKGEPMWDAEKGALIANLDITGIENHIRRAVAGRMAGAAS
ncbi:MAG: hypothetical protein GX580_09795 [Candidatus Hydrogenedens sp.]|nr:hypothetical protein [Candidatus Hydrogenedentota bacterium]NLF57919.1 hypothetical protein [Candidatus Hydrogenedens sp.]